MRRFKTLLAAATVGVFTLAGCGDDVDETATDETATTTTTTEAEQPDEAALAYCQESEGLDQQQGPPTEEQLQELADVAPPEIQEDVQVSADRFAEMGLDAFSDPAFNEAIERIEAWEMENCPGGASDEDGEGESTS